MRSLLTLSDVMCAAHHAAVSACVTRDSVVAVVGDGAVGLCAVIAARRLGASRIFALSRNSARQQLARSFGATDIIAERGVNKNNTRSFRHIFSAAATPETHSSSIPHYRFRVC